MVRVVSIFRRFSRSYVRAFPRAFVADMLRCWLRSWKRFASIAVITLLGVAVLTGIYAGCRDAFRTAGRFYESQGLHDVQVLSTYGLTDDDVAALRAIDGVAVVQPERSQNATLNVDGSKKIVTLREIGSYGIDQPYLQHGRMPSTAGEVAVTQGFLNDSGLRIGSSVTVTPVESSSAVLAGAEDSDGSSSTTTSDQSSGAADDTAGLTGNADDSSGNSSSDGSSSDGVTTTTSGEESSSSVGQAAQFPTDLTIVGVVIEPQDLSNPNGYSAMTSFRSTTTQDYTFFAPSAGVTGTIYTAINLSVVGAAGLDTFSSAYDDAVREVADRIEQQVQTERQRARRDQIVADAQTQLDDARNDATRQLADAQAEIDRNRAELDANAATFADGRKQLADQQTTLTDGERQLADGRSQLATARTQIAQGRKQIADARTQLESGKSQLADARRQLDSAQAELTTNRTKVEQGLTQIDQGLAQIDQMLPLIEQGLDLLEQIGAGASDETSGASDLSGVSDETDSGVESLNLLDETHASESDNGMESRDSTDPERNDANATTESPLWQVARQLLAQLGITVPDLPSIDDLTAQLTAKRDELTAQRDQLTQQRAQLQSTLDTTIIPAQATLDEQNAQLTAKERETAEGERELNAQSAELETNADELETRSAQLEAKAAELASGRAQLEAAQRKLDDGEQQLADGRKQLEDAQSQLDTKRNDANAEFARQQRRIDNVANAHWYVQTRASLGGFSAFKSDISSIESIGRAFPIVFLLVAVLMSLTTMTRMVEEDRGLIGTYLGLGYSGGLVAARYVLFALLACLIGGGLGLVAGFLGIPAFLLVVIEGLYVLPGVRLEYDWVYGTGGVLLFVIGVVVATVLACRGELRQTPSALIRPKAPKAGARILLERVRPVWSRLNFLNKVTARNIVRFKSRLVMTVGGVAGCTALIVCGFAINDSVAMTGPTQYGGIYRYDAMVVATDADASAMRARLASDGKTREMLSVRIESGELSVDNTTGTSSESGGTAGKSESIQLTIVPRESLNKLSDMVALQSVSKHKAEVALDNSGVIVSQSAAHALGIKSGNIVTLRGGDMTRANVTVAAVTRSLVGSDVYISETLYDQLFASDNATGTNADKGASAAEQPANGADSNVANESSTSSELSAQQVTDQTDQSSQSPSTITWNAVLATLKGNADEQIAYVNQLADDPSVMKVVSTADLKQRFGFDLMGAVVALIVGLAGALALVVLFTLANTNVSERVREMATLKVLGFFDGEVHRYVNREMMILTVLGVAVGLPLGRWIGGLLTAALAMPGLYFEVTVHWTSYLIAAAATLAFALLVQLFTNPVLDRIDPAASLKSVE